MSDPEHLDVLIVGAGLSGIGVAWRLQREHPGRSYAILEVRDASGGTWDLFRYPGIRSDSDLSTFAYEFKPWRGSRAIADGAAILDYIRETAREAGIDRRIRFGQRVVRAAWSSEAARWTVTAATAGGGTVTLTASWLFCATGYYRYDAGYTPDMPGIGSFAGPVIHPQQWPADLDAAGRRIVVIGSGATAVTLVPALAEAGAHVTMLQRSPSYVLAVPGRDPIADLLRRCLGPARAHRLVRRKNILMQRATYAFCRRHPRRARRVLRALTARQLPPHVDVDTHFRPAYDPWDQRLCIAPDGDLFAALRAGTAAIVTDRIETITPAGVRLASGGELAADVLVTATGLTLLAFGGTALAVDGEPVVLSDTVAFRGMMLGGLPNFAFAVGYTNSSWTLKVDLVAEHFCRLLAHMDAQGHDVAVPRGGDPAMATRPLLDFAAGYIRRSLDELPRQGSRPPWQVATSYYEDVRDLRRAAVTDPELRFSRRAAASGEVGRVDHVVA